MKNIHILPTDKPSRLLWSFENRRYYSVKEEILFKNQNELQNQNIYITSNEEIKEGDYYINLQNRPYINRSGETKFKGLYDNCKKIILTTDQSLDGVQAIPDEFLKWFVNNPSCEIIDIEKSTNTTDNIDSNIPTIPWTFYKIIIPSEEPKQAAFNYSLNAFKVPKEYFGKELTKEEVMKGRSSAYEFLDFDKQETLEQVAERILANNIDGLKDALNDNDLFYFYKGVVQCYGEAMAKYQQERSYSEEDLREAFLQGWMIRERFEDISPDIIYPDGLDYEEKQDYAFNLWFEKFKKK